MGFIGNKRRMLMLSVDLGIFSLTYLLTITLQIVSQTGYYNIGTPAILVNFVVSAFFVFVARIGVRVYSIVWRYANSWAFLRIVVADIIGGITGLFVTYFAQRIFIGLYQTISLVAMCNVVTLVSRFAYQQKYRFSREATEKHGGSKIGIAIVGAGQIGTLLAEELKLNTYSKYRPICFIDNDPAKIGSRILDLPVYSDDNYILDRIKNMQVQEIFIAVPKASGDKLKAMYEFYSASNCPVKVYDQPINFAAGGEGAKGVIREIKIEDLLFRGGLKVADEKAIEYYSNKIVLVTGGGGSIGSELCRQVAKANPKKLIIFDIYENNAYDIQQELLRVYRDTLDLQVEIGSVRDRKRLEAVFAHYRPDVVFHAAAHKHVPLMEHSNAEVIKNNVIGTYNAADMAEKYGTEKFILISTDKAVNPTNVMGASKRLCEMIVQCRKDSKTTFAAVRFGNVLGSNGSVIPLFKRQIEMGGPVTVTDKRIIRYFMTIPEASGLVIQAGAMAKRNELFVLDMGKPVKILDLAENIIKLSGHVPYRDIEIIETGLRPGEKLYEELLIKTENLDKTENNMIFIERDLPLSRECVDEKLRVLKDAVAYAENEIAAESIKEAMMSVVPTFKNPEEINKNAQNSEEMKLLATV